MLYLPKDQRLTIRTLDTPLRKLVASIDDTWIGDRISVVMSDRAAIKGQVLGGTPNHRVFRLEMQSGIFWSVALSVMAGIRTYEHVVEVDSSWVGEYLHGADPGVDVDAAVAKTRGPTALVVFNRTGYDPYSLKHQHRADVTFYIHDFAVLPDKRDELMIAREAFLSDDKQRARDIAIKALPKTYGLFLALLRREQSELANASVE